MLLQILFITVLALGMFLAFISFSARLIGAGVVGLIKILLLGSIMLLLLWLAWVLSAAWGMGPGPGS